ncbi:HNH endonuclease [Halobacillus mangrovi]|uniref:HNH endonuclease n=1 Tax=Halobacillus mangrovi TaxID=402384 RepID=A0A1W5ZX17_9BACI|nr:hypothetical protein [Halobacillus mangrovi]ARI77842.1 hypothetical protein HM131_13720 [Halobacillus mangrovi]
MSDFKLTVEIRKPSYAQNKTVRNSIPRSLWNSVRNHVQENSDFTCQICGYRVEEKLQAHEVWEYDEENFLLILKDIQSLCKSCHDLKHIHHVTRRIEDSNTRGFVMQNLKKHFMRVNECTEKDFRKHYRNQLAKSNTSPINRSLEDLIEIRKLREKEEFLKEQNWQFVLAKNVPFAKEIESKLDEKGLLYKGQNNGT